MLLCGQCSAKKVSEIYNLSREGVRKICIRENLDKKLARLNLQKNVALSVSEGISKTNVCEKFGVNVSFIKESCFLHGVPFTPKGCNSDKVIEIISDLINDKQTLSFLSKKHCVSPYIISQIYSKCILSSVLVAERKPGKTSTKSVTYKICIPVDDVIDNNPPFFSFLTNILFEQTEIHIIASSLAGKIEDITNELIQNKIKYHFLSIEDDRRGYILNKGINIVFETEDNYIKDIPEQVAVFKLRDGENFSFESFKWLYSDSTGEIC
jgi:hypothetical protein